MATLNKNHQELNEKGEGKCSVPMWMGGCPAGFCDETAYGKETKKHKEWMRLTDRFQHIPGLACPGHGGPKKEDVVNLCANCKKQFPECDANYKFGNGTGKDNIYECDGFIF